MNKNVSVIIPSAKLVPEELQHIGKLPGIAYPINQRIVFDYLYEQYQHIRGTINIVCYEAIETVRRRLGSYSDERIQLLELPELKDLGHSVHFGIQDCNSPVYINFGDTIVMDTDDSENDDVIFYSEDYLSTTWTYFEDDQGRITEIYDKISLRSEEKKKLFIGLFKIADSQYFKACLERSFCEKNRKVSSFYHALQLYSQSHPFTLLPVRSWFDIGHMETYSNSALEVRAREFNHITVDKQRGILRKTSDSKEKFIGEILWYLKLPSDIEYVRPRIFSYSTDYASAYVAMEYYSYHTLHELFLHGDLNYHQWIDIFKRIRFVLEDFKRYTVGGDKIPAALQDMYLNKTLHRLDQLRDKPAFAKFFEKEICVNGQRYQSLDRVYQILKEVIPSNLYDVDTFHVIHGDLCFANIMVDRNFSFIKVIDPRGKFGAFDIYGDTRYELAKLFHSVDGKYDFIIKDRFNIHYNPEMATIDYSIWDYPRNYDLYKMLQAILKDEIGNDLQKIEMIEALLFLSMIPLHGESEKHQMAMLATGLQILNRSVDITVEA